MCPYNKSVDCDEKDRRCEKCGWNPDVEELRKFKARMKLALKKK